MTETNDKKDYPRPSLTGDCVIFKDAHVLLIKRKRWPFEGMWALPGGFVNEYEEPYDAAVRELKEETHVEGAYLRLVNVFGKKGRDPRGWIVSVAYVADVSDKDIQARAGDDAADVMWVPVNTHMQLAFDHNEILAEAIKVYERVVGA